MAQKVNKVVLAYSGGLDTSVIVPWLIENYGCEVICFCADVGQGEELAGLEERAIQSGASNFILLDLKDELVSDYIFPMIQSGAVYENKYLLGTSIARPLVAKKQVEIAHMFGADAVSHGCTGKGNDQVRFEMGFAALDPSLHVIAPWREWDIQSREDALNYLTNHHLPAPFSKNPSLLSRDRNLWHISHEGGPLEDPNYSPEEWIFQLTASQEAAPNEAEIVDIGFQAGLPVSINGQLLNPVELIQTMNQIGGKHGVGRVDLIENRLVGMKSRGIYETPGGTLLYTAHQELESLCLDRETYHYKNVVAQRYAELVYFGQWFSPLRASLDAFFHETQKCVTGSIKLKLFKGTVSIAGRVSQNSLYRPDIATFGHSTTYNHQDAAGFIRLFSLPSRVQASLDQTIESQNDKISYSMD